MCYFQRLKEKREGTSNNRQGQDQNYCKERVVRRGLAYKLLTESCQLLYFPLTCVVICYLLSVFHANLIVGIGKYLHIDSVSLAIVCHFHPVLPLAAARHHLGGV